MAIDAFYEIMGAVAGTAGLTTKYVVRLEYKVFSVAGLSEEKRKECFGPTRKPEQQGITHILMGRRVLGEIKSPWNVVNECGSRNEALAMIAKHAIAVNPGLIKAREKVAEDKVKARRSLSLLTKLLESEDHYSLATEWQHFINELETDNPRLVRYKKDKLFRAVYYKSMHATTMKDKIRWMKTFLLCLNRMSLQEKKHESVS